MLLPKKIGLTFIYIVLGVNCYSQLSVSSKDTNYSNKLSGMVMAITDVTISKQMTYTLCGIAGALRFNDKFYAGIYGMGLMTNLKGSDFNHFKPVANYQVSYSQGGVCVGYINNTIWDKFSFVLALKTAYGALFMYDPQNVIEYNFARDELLIITPSVDTEIFLTNWLKINLGMGFHFVDGISTLYSDENDVKSLYYNYSALKGVCLSFSLYFGSYTNFKKQ